MLYVERLILRSVFARPACFGCADRMNFDVADGDRRVASLCVRAMFGDLYGAGLTLADRRKNEGERERERERERKGKQS